MGWGGGSGGLSEFVCRNKLCAFGPKLRTISQRGARGGGGKSVHFWKSLVTESPKISIAEA